MVRADLFLLGYFRISIAAEDKRLVSDIFLKREISVTIRRDNTFIIPYRQKNRIEQLLSGRVSYEISEPLGLYGALVRNKKRYGAFLGIFFVAALFFLSSRIVWDVRIEGEYEGDEKEILAELSEAGLSVGRLWSRLDTAEIEMNTLEISDKIGWLNINRRGTVAYVVISEKDIHAPNVKPEGYANIVAARDCVIEEIIVKNGYATVKKGESVRKGDVLISGVIPTELGGGFCYAEGEVIGSYPEKISISVSEEKTEKHYAKKELCNSAVNFFGININIFKKTRQSEALCDIIKEKEQLTFVKRLPITVEKTYCLPYEIKSISLSREEMTALASEKLAEALTEFLKDKEAKRLITSGEFFEGGYRMVCDTVVSSDVTEIKEFYTE